MGVNKYQNRQRRWGLLLFVFLFGGCQSWPPQSDFYNHRYDIAAANCEQVIAQEPAGKNYAYHRVYLGSIAFTAGDYQRANRIFREALKVMEQYGGDATAETLALIGSERGKVYKGDPYEKMMAHYYTGMTFYAMGDYAKALAGFKNALSADAVSPEEQYRGDCTLLHLMGAKTALKLSNMENAKMLIREGRRFDNKNPCLHLEKIAAANLLFIIEAGRGPRKRLAGPGKSIEVVVPRDFPDHKVQVFIDEKLVGEPCLMADITKQARTGGKSKASAIRETKGVVGDLAAGVPLAQSKADKRCWTFLPGKIFALPVKIAPGPHKITIKFYEKDGTELTAYQQSWENCSVGTDTLYYFRSGKDKSKVITGMPQPLSSTK